MQTRYRVCSDSKAAFDALNKTTTESSVVWDYMLALNRLGESHELTLVWAPGHQGIPGNETAERLAGLGTYGLRGAGHPLCHRKKYHLRLEKEHSNSWKLICGCK